MTLVNNSLNSYSINKDVTMDKISYYNITIPYKQNILLYNTLTNSIVCFTDEEFSIINGLFKSLNGFSSQYHLLYSKLKESGFIIEEDFDELAYIKLQNKRCVFSNNAYHLTINPTLDCNLRCWYCSTEYAKALHHGGMTSKVMSLVKKHLSSLAEEQKAARLHLDWFGGEPMLYFKKVIKPISTHTLNLVEKNGIRYSQHITTNATLINGKILHEMADLRFTSFQIPIDGNERHHNAIKRYEDKTGTYRTIIDNINLIADIIPDARITLRINYDKQTLKNIKDIVPDITPNAKERIKVDFQKVWQITCNENDFNRLKEMKDFFYSNGLNSDFWAYNPKSFRRCYSDCFHHYAINYNGKIFKCTAQNYGDDKVIGKFSSNGRILWNDKLLSKLFSKSTFENEKCLKCKSLPICMGPCITRNYEAVQKKTPIPCVADYVQYPLSSFIINEAAKRGILIK